MIDINEIQNEIDLEIMTRINKHEVVKLPWLIQGVLSRHGDVAGSAGEEFAIYSMQKQASKMCKNSVKKFSQDESEDEVSPQMVLAGMEQLRVAYSMKREDGMVIVPIELCTLKELAERAGQLEKISESTKKHSEEIRAYIRGMTSSNTA